MSKTISKPLLDEAMNRGRFHYGESEDGTQSARSFVDACVAVERSAGLCLCAISDLLACIFPGLKPDATNEDIYKVLEVLGWTVVDE